MLVGAIFVTRWKRVFHLSGDQIFGYPLSPRFWSVNKRKLYLPLYFTQSLSVSTSLFLSLYLTHTCIRARAFVRFVSSTVVGSCGSQRAITAPYLAGEQRTELEWHITTVSVD